VWEWEKHKNTKTQKHKNTKTQKHKNAKTQKQHKNNTKTMVRVWVGLGEIRARTFFHVGAVDKA